MSENVNTQTQQEWPLPKNPYLPTIAVMIATFIAILDSTVANVAMPHMAGSLSATTDEITWVLTSYIIASGIILPSVDWFSKVFGRRNYLMFCVLLFTVSSILCGLSTSLDQIVLARILQGLGGGALMPLSQAILLESFPRSKQALAMAIFGLGVLFAPIIGPLVGGWITDNYSWHWIFYINIPIGILAIILIKMWVVDPPYAQKQGFQKIDFVGFFFLVAWIASMQVVLDKGNNADWFGSPWICWLTAICIISMISFFVSQFIRKNTLLDLSVFKNRNYAIGTVVLTLIMGVMYASMAIMPLFLQNLLGYNAFLSGYAVAPRGVGSIIAIVLTGFLPNKINDKLLGVGLVILAISCFMCGTLSMDISMYNIVIPNLLMGIGTGFCMMPITTLSMRTIRNEDMVNATGIQSLMKEVGGGIGTSLVATFLSRYSQMHQAHMVGHLHDLNTVFVEKLSANIAGLSQYFDVPLATLKANYLMYRELLVQSSLWAYMDVFRITGIVCLIMIPLVFLFNYNVKVPTSESEMIKD